MAFNLTCNSTLEDMRITTEKTIVGNLTFHQLALIIGGACAALSIVASLFLMFCHAINYTKPREQKHIIRILFMVPVYSVSAFLSIWFYWHAVYFEVISNCYEAFAISSFFALMCHYVAPDLHEQKEFFREMRPVKPWVLPVSWFGKCCGGQRGPWRTPKSGLTWFNIIWIGVYHYCFIRITMTITAVVTQYFDRYCESSNSPVFAHVWVIVIEAIAVTIAMYCIIQFYVQMREGLAEHKPFLKVLAIKLVIFLSFWQTIAISLGTSSTLNIVHPGEHMAYPDLKVGIPNLLLCIEMAIFSIMHLWTFPWQPYKPGAPATFYPVPDPATGMTPRANEHLPKQGGFLGVKAFWDAANVWDIIKAFGRGVRWLFVGVKHRKEDVSYQTKPGHESTDTTYPMTAYGQEQRKSTDHLPVASQFRRSTFGMADEQQTGIAVGGAHGGALDERQNLIDHSQAYHQQQQPSRAGHHDNPYDNPYENTVYDQDPRTRGAVGNAPWGYNNNPNVPPGSAR